MGDPLRVSLLFPGVATSRGTVEVWKESTASKLCCATGLDVLPALVMPAAPCIRRKLFCAE